MLKYKEEQIEKSNTNLSENWFWEKYLNPLKKNYWIKFTRQAMWGTRIYDFRCKDKWIAIEIDWKYHNNDRKKEKDEKYDKYNYWVSWIVVLRIPPFDKDMSIDVIEKVKQSCLWKHRRVLMWLITKVEKKNLKRLYWF